mgnify:FL=1
MNYTNTEKQKKTKNDFYKTKSVHNSYTKFNMVIMSRYNVYMLIVYMLIEKRYDEYFLRKGECNFTTILNFS